VSAPARFEATIRCFGCGRRRAAAAAGLIALAFVLIASAPANALVSGHTYDFSFGSGFGPGNGQFGAFENGFIYGMGVAVDQQTGDVYVADPSAARIQKFDSSGNFLQVWGFGVANGANESQVCSAPATCHFGIQGAAPGQFDHPTSIAVDNSGGESDGDVYVADTNTPVGGSSSWVHKFTRNGAYLGRVDGADTPGGVFGSLSYRQAIAVDENGLLWVAGGGRIVKYTGESENEYVGGSEFGFGSTSFATNAAGTRLDVIAGYSGVFRLSANGFSKEEIFPGPSGESIFAIGENPWIGVDPVTEHAYIAYDGRVREYGLDNQQAAPIFGSGSLSSSGGIAFKNDSGIVYVADPSAGKVVAFKPRTVPDVTTEPATDTSVTAATLNGEVAPEPLGGGNVIECHFEVGTDTSYGTPVPCDQTMPLGGPTTVSADVSGLSAETTYHYRLVASNSIDANGGKDETFTTHAVKEVSTDPATDLTTRSAVLNASFDPANEATHYYFEWGPDSSYGNVTSTPPGPEVPASSGTVHVSAPIEGLSSYATYHFRVVASNGIGTSYGNDETVITAAPALPTITETGSRDVSDNRATVEATVNPDFGQATYVFEYGKTAAYGKESLQLALPDADGLDHAVSSELTGLAAGTTYHFRAVAINFGGTTHGPDMTFTTQDLPSIEGIAASGVTQTAATFSGLIDPHLSSTRYRFELGPGPGYGLRTGEESLTGLSGLIRTGSLTVTGLNPGTTYHFRAVATNALGSTTSADQTFMTLPAPARDGGIPTTRCKKGFVKKRGKCVKRRKPKHRKSHRGHRHG
jgi:hypothetical protein